MVGSRCGISKPANWFVNSHNQRMQFGGWLLRKRSALSWPAGLIAPSWRYVFLANEGDIRLIIAGMVILSTG
jgi:hypothetical protein